jgi:hypothetical protein
MRPFVITPVQEELLKKFSGYLHSLSGYLAVLSQPAHLTRCKCLRSIVDVRVHRNFLSITVWSGKTHPPIDHSAYREAGRHAARMLDSLVMDWVSGPFTNPHFVTSELGTISRGIFRFRRDSQFNASLVIRHNMIISCFLSQFLSSEVDYLGPIHIYNSLQWKDYCNSVAGPPTLCSHDLTTLDL